MTGAKHISDAETRIIAGALYEIRLLLSAYLGRENEAPAEVRFAAHLAYALHNEALASMAGTGFDIDAALNKVASIDGILSTADGKRLADAWRRPTSAT